MGDRPLELVEEIGCFIIGPDSSDARDGGAKLSGHGGATLQIDFHNLVGDRHSLAAHQEEHEQEQTDWEDEVRDEGADENEDGEDARVVLEEQVAHRGENQVSDAHIFGEAIEDSADRLGVEEAHGRGENRAEHSTVELGSLVESKRHDNGSLEERK